MHRLVIDYSFLEIGHDLGQRLLLAKFRNYRKK
jgi:hypothetical protein